MQKRINQISSTISVLQKPEMKFINSSSRYSIITNKVKSAIQQLYQQKPLQWFTTKLPDLPKELCSWEEWQLPAQKSQKLKELNKVQIIRFHVRQCEKIIIQCAGEEGDFVSPNLQEKRKKEIRAPL